MEVKEAFNVRLLFICQVLIRLYAVFLFSVCKRVWSILYFFYYRMQHILYKDSYFFVIVGKRYNSLVVSA